MSRLLCSSALTVLLGACALGARTAQARPAEPSKPAADPARSPAGAGEEGEAPARASRWEWFGLEVGGGATLGLFSGETWASGHGYFLLRAPTYRGELFYATTLTLGMFFGEGLLYYLPVLGSELGLSFGPIEVGLSFGGIWMFWYMAYVGPTLRYTWQLSPRFRIAAGLRTPFVFKGGGASHDRDHRSLLAAAFVDLGW